MGLFSFLKRKKKKPAPETEPEELLPLDEAGLEGIDPPETRYTQEYQDFLASQEAGENAGELPEEDRELPEEELPEADEEEP